MTTQTREKDENIVWHSHAVDKAQRAKLKNQRPAVLWFTGLSGAGKSTVAARLKPSWRSWVTIPICLMAIMFVMACVAIWDFQSKTDVRTFAALVSWRN